MIEWLVGITEKKDFPIDINKQLMMRPDYQKGDIAVKYGKDKKCTIPQKCLIGNLKERVPATDQNIEVGSVVMNKLTDEEMTVIWIIGQKIESSVGLDLNQMYKMRGFSDGDIVCGYFEKREYKTNLFKLGEITKILCFPPLLRQLFYKTNYFFLLDCLRKRIRQFKRKKYFCGCKIIKALVPSLGIIKFYILFYPSV